MNINQTPPNASPQTPDQQWLAAKLNLRAELKFDTRNENGKVFVVIEDPVRSKFFQVGTDEFEFIAALDGQKTAVQILESCPALTEPQAVSICQWLVQSNLAISSSLDSAKRLGMQAKAIDRQKMMGWLNPISFKINLFNPNRLLTQCQPAFTWLFSKTFLLVWLVVGAFAMSALYSHWDELGSASAGILSGYSWVSMLVFWLLLKAVHEAAHGLACKRYGGEVPEAGILFLLFTPMAFVNVTSMWRFPSRWQRIVVAGAGMYVELFISFIALLVWSRTTGMTADTAWQVFLMSSVTTILFNANPLMRFDGYFILSDLVNVPNLYPKGTRWFGDRIKNLFFGTTKTANIFAPEEGTVVRVYGTMAWFWKISISVGLIIAASVMFNGAGLAMGIVGALLWFGLPIFKQCQMMLSANGNTPLNKTRTAFSFLVVAAIMAGMFFVLKAPATKSAPALVQFSDETIIRAAADGFVDEILVKNGDLVEAGQILMRSHNDDLETEINRTKTSLDTALIQSRIHRQQREFALVNVEQEMIAGYQQQLAEQKEQRDALALRSPIAGRVFQRNLDQLIGSFVKRGDTLMSVAQQDTKELVVSVDQSDLESIKKNLGGPVRVMLPGRNVFESNISRIDPRASEMPAEIRLCATAGGPLPVKPNPNAQNNDGDDPSFVLLSPRFSARVPIEPSMAATMHSGQRCQVFFSSTEQSLGSYFYLATTQWLKNKIEMALQTATM